MGTSFEVAFVRLLKIPKQSLQISIEVSSASLPGHLIDDQKMLICLFHMAFEDDSKLDSKLELERLVIPKEHDKVNIIGSLSFLQLHFFFSLTKQSIEHTFAFRLAGLDDRRRACKLSGQNEGLNSDESQVTNCKSLQCPGNTPGAVSFGSPYSFGILFCKQTVCT